MERFLYGRWTALPSGSMVRERRPGPGVSPAESGIFLKFPAVNGEIPSSVRSNLPCNLHFGQKRGDSMRRFPREVQRVSIVLKPSLMAWRISFSSKVGSGGGEAPEGGHGEKRGSPCSGTAQFMSCRISEAPVARMAPSRMRAWHPSEECRSTGPGMQKRLGPVRPPFGP